MKRTAIITHHRSLKKLVLLTIGLTACLGTWGQTFEGLYMIKSYTDGSYYIGTATSYYGGNTATPYLDTYQRNTVWAAYSYNGKYLLQEWESGKYMVMARRDQAADAVYIKSMDNPTTGGAEQFTIDDIAGGVTNIIPTGTQLSLNPFGGHADSRTIGLYGAWDGGSKWYFESVGIPAPAISIGSTGTVTMSHIYPSFAIRYTTDGTTPTASSTLYTGSFNLSPNATVKAIATLGNASSPVASEQYVAATEISSLSQITNISGNYRLTQDIDASGSSIINNFSGRLDGDFHKITGLTHPIFGTLAGEVCNVIVDNCTIANGTDVGAIAGTANGDARIYNCGVLASDTSTIVGTGNVGSIVGKITGNARVLNCFSYATVSGGTAAGIVGSNNGTAVDRTTILGGTGSMVFNCIFFGTVSGTYKYPVFGGSTIENVYNNSNTTGINTYNYFLYDGSATYTGMNSAAGVIEKRYLNRFNLYRDMLNSHRDLCAMYINNTQPPTDGQKYDIAVWDYSAATKATIPYLHLEKLQTNTRRTLERAIPSTTEAYAGKQLGTVACTFIINGTNFSQSLPLTDMDTAKHDYTWGKIVLPFANEFSGWTMPASGSNDYDKIVVGWEITSIAGGTAGSTPTAANFYNFCDPDCTAKDLYTNTGYVWAQGGNYIVPNGVSAITFTAHIVNAYYLSDPYPDEGFNSNYSTSCFTGTQLSGDTYNGKTVYHSLKAAYDKMENQNSHNPASQAVVLVGNYHISTYSSNSSHTDKNVWNESGNTFNNSYALKAATIMSIDADNNQMPDYALVCAVTNSPGRAECPPTRFDFVSCPGLGISSYTRSGNLPNVAIMHSAGWFEVTETGFMHLTEYEVRPQAFKYENSPCILNGGIYEKFIFGSNRTSSGNNNKFSYFKFGGNVYITDFNPGHKNNSNDPNVTYTPKPVNVCGGQIDLCYMNGQTYGLTQTGDVHFFANGGYIKTFQGANQSKLVGNMTAVIHHALIDEYYGGGAVATYAGGQITGNISTTINDSYVKFFVAGPKFGDMASGKSVTTVANGTTFGEYYGAGYGGTSLVKNRESSDSPAFNGTDRNYNRPWSTFSNKRLEYDANYGTCVSYNRTYFIYAGGGVPGTKNGNETFNNEYATLSLAQTHNVTSTMTNCTFEKDFYGGGCQGSVNGTITSTLTGCTVAGSVFGGGYKADATPIKVYGATDPGLSVFKASMGFFTKFGTPTAETYTWTSGTDGAVNNTNKTIGTSVNMSNMGRVFDNISLTIEGGTVGENVYGGGHESPSDASVTVLIRKYNQQDAIVTGHVFGGGLGETAIVGQNTEVKVLDGTQIGKNVYGGGHGAKVRGNTHVVIGQ